MAAQPAACVLLGQLHKQAFHCRGCGCCTGVERAGGVADHRGVRLGELQRVADGTVCVGSGSGGLYRAVLCGQGQGAVRADLVSALFALDTGIFSVVIVGNGIAAILHQVDVAAQPAACIGLGQFHEQAVLCFFRSRGALGGLGSGCALGGSRRCRCAAAEEHGPEHQRHHGSDAHADTGLCALAQFFTGGDALEDQQNDGDEQDAVHDGQQDEPVGGVIHSCRNGDAVCLRVQDVVAGAAHGLLCGVGRRIQLDAHQAEHHVAACTEGKVDVHPAGVAHGRVGDHHAVEAPFVAEHIGEQCLGSACPSVAKAAVTAHDSGGAALLDRKLKGLEVNFADGLLVCPDRDGQTVGLLIVQGKVLDIGVHALTVHALHHGSAHLAGQQAVLAVILKVTAGEGGAVDVHAGGIQTHHMVCGGFGTKSGAKALGKVGVPAGTHDDLAGEGNALQAADQTVDAGRAVQIIGGGLAHAGNFRGGPAAVGDHVGHVVHAELLQQVVPLGVIVFQPGHILQGQAVVGNGNGLVAVFILVDRGVLLGGNGLCAGSLAVGAGGGQSALPVGAGDVLLDLTLCHILKLVGGSHKVGAAGVFAAVSDGGGHFVLPLVDHLVGVAHQLDLVSTGFQNVSLCAGLIVGSHVLRGKGDGHLLGSAGLQQACLCKACQHHMGFFNAADGVGCGVVDLHHVLACHSAGVLDLHGHLDGAVGGLVISDRLLKGGVGQTVAEGVLHCLCVGGFIAQAGGVVHIAGLVEAVAHIDALGVLHIVVLEVGVSKVAGVPVSRSGGQVVSVGIRQTAGGVHLAGQNLAHGVEAGGAEAADPQSGINGVILQKAQFHGVGGVDEHDHLAKALCLDERQQVLFVLRQLQIMSAVIGLAVTGGVHILRQVAALAAHAGDGDDGHIREGLGILQQRVGVLGCGHLGGGEVGAFKALLGCTADAGLLVKIHQLLIDREPGVGQAGDEVNVGGGVACTGAAAAVDGVHGAVAEQVDGGALCQRQGVVLILQQNSTLLHQLLCHGAALLCRLLHGQALAGGHLLLTRQQRVEVCGHKRGDSGIEDSAGDVDHETDGQQHRNGNDAFFAGRPLFVTLFHYKFLAFPSFFW